MSTNVERLKREAMAGDLDAARELYRLAQRIADRAAQELADRAIHPWAVQSIEEGAVQWLTALPKFESVREAWRFASCLLRSKRPRGMLLSQMRQGGRIGPDLDPLVYAVRLVRRATGAVLIELRRAQVAPTGDWLGVREHMRRVYRVSLTREQALKMAQGEMVEVGNLLMRSGDRAWVLPRGFVSAGPTRAKITLPYAQRDREYLDLLWGAQR